MLLYKNFNGIGKRFSINEREKNCEYVFGIQIKIEKLMTILLIL